MKTIYYYRYGIAILLTVAIAFSSCKKKDHTEEPVAPTGTFMFHLHTYIQDNEVDLYNIPYTTHEGRSISLGLAQLYISNVEIVKLDGSVYSFPTARLLKVLETDTYMIGEAPVGNYKALRFKVGLPPDMNIPSISNPSDSLMWLSRSELKDGYTFLNVRGMIDTSENYSEPMVPFSYKIGTNVHYKQVNMPEKGFTIVAGEVQYAHLIADYNMLFRGIKVNDNSNLFIQTTADNALPLAEKIVNNIPSMFMFEQ
jgi:hypothetical protein